MEESPRELGRPTGPPRPAPCESYRLWAEGRAPTRASAGHERDVRIEQ